MIMIDNVWRSMPKVMSANVIYSFAPKKGTSLGIASTASSRSSETDRLPSNSSQLTQLTQLTLPILPIYSTEYSSCLAMFGHVWPCLAMCGHVWSRPNFRAHVKRCEDVKHILVHKVGRIPLVLIWFLNEPSENNICKWPVDEAPSWRSASPHDAQLCHGLGIGFFIPLKSWCP